MSTAVLTGAVDQRYRRNTVSPLGPVARLLRLASAPLSDQQALTLAHQDGFAGEALVTMVSIGHAESGLDPRARNENRNAATGQLLSTDRGIVQINDAAWPGITDAMADNPTVAFRLAYNPISRKGTTFQPWSTYNAGAHLPFMDRVRVAASKIGLLAPPPPVAWAWDVELPNVPLYDQNKDWTADGQGDENAKLNCGPESLAICIAHLTDVELPADYIHDVMKGQGAAGYTSVNDLTGFLKRHCGINAVIHSYPVNARWGTPAPYRMIADVRTALAAGHPLIHLRSFSAPNAPDGHFMVMKAARGTGEPGKETRGQVDNADPWTGTMRREGWKETWSWSKGVVIEVQRKRCIAV